MKKVILLIFLLTLFGCSEPIRYLKGEYHYSYSPFGGESFVFDDSSHFHYYYGSDGGDQIIGEGTYYISDDILQLNFYINKYDRPVIYYKLDSSITINDEIVLNIYMKDSYTQKPISSGSVSIYNSKKLLLRSDSCDSNGYIIIKLSESSDSLTLKTGFRGRHDRGYYYKQSINIKADKSYNIIFFTVKHDESGGNYYDGETVNYKIKYMSKEYFEVISNYNDKKIKKFVKEKDKK